MAFGKNQTEKPEKQPEPAKKFVVNFPYPPHEGRIQFCKTIIHRGENAIEDRDDAILLLARPGVARFNPLDAVGAGLLKMGEVKFLGHEVPEPCEPIRVKIPGEERQCPAFSALPAHERQEWAERLNIALPVKETVDQHSERLEQAWRLHWGGK